jgi:hypothetical protein
VPLFRPGTPSSDEEEAAPALTSRSRKNGKQQMIVEVVLPLRKTKGKAVAGV